MGYALLGISQRVHTDWGIVVLIATVLTVAELCMGGYPIVDTGQEVCFDSSVEMTCPAGGQAFAGQDAQYDGNQPSFALSGDGLTVFDNVTGLTWTQSEDWDTDGDIDTYDKFTFAEFEAHPATLNAIAYGGYDDWRTPTIKELYSLIDFRGRDISSFQGTDPTGIPMFIDTDYFDAGYGDLNAAERLIDGQVWSNTQYVDTTMNGSPTVFGVNFPDGRIKGYGRDTGPGGTATHYVFFVRGNTTYGVNNFSDNSNGTITDEATGLMWQQADSGAGYTWEQALAYAEALDFAGHDDWRLPNVKELQSILDYTRSPATHGTAAIDPLFTCSAIIDEGGGSDFPFYWSGTTHADTRSTPGTTGAYFAFGTGYGFMQQPPGSGNYNLLDVHGAGCQRSDPKEGDPSDYPYGHGPQGDVIRIFNYVRCVRDAARLGDVNGDGNVNELDIEPMVYVLLYGETAFGATYPDGCYNCANCNQDTAVNGLDVDAFVALIIGG